MSDGTTTLQAEKREKVGTRYSQRLRAAGKLPAVIYGHKKEPVSVTLDAKETIRSIQKGEKLFSLDLGGVTEHVLLKDLGYDHLGTNIIHADLARVDLNERVDTRAAISIIGDAVGLKVAGAALMNPLHELELNCLVTNLPDEIEVDVSGLEAGESIVAKDVKLPLDTMILLTDPDAVVASVEIMKTAESDEESEVGGDAQPELVDEKKADNDAKDGE